jgi:hypothetical protein
MIPERIWIITTVITITCGTTKSSIVSVIPIRQKAMDCCLQETSMRTLGEVKVEVGRRYHVFPFDSIPANGLQLERLDTWGETEEIPIPDPTFTHTVIAFLGIQAQAADLARNFVLVAALDRQFLICGASAKLVKGEKEDATSLHPIGVLCIQTTYRSVGEQPAQTNHMGKAIGRFPLQMLKKQLFWSPDQREKICVSSPFKPFRKESPQNIHPSHMVV